MADSIIRGERLVDRTQKSIWGQAEIWSWTSWGRWTSQGRGLQGEYAIGNASRASISRC